MTYRKKLIEVALPLEDINRDLPAPRLRQAGAAWRHLLNSSP